MRLKSLEISGFKSFAKKASFTFDASISSIVGPNGSGKSNVAEAFRFVLGEQSIKSMRGKKGEDLIFNGGNDGARVHRASVKVIFDNPIIGRNSSNENNSEDSVLDENKTHSLVTNSYGRALAVDFDEVTIERVVHRDGANEYFINNTRVRLRDVIELLAGAHIGSSGHHIISQGEADRILSASPKERREMIEDALGLKVYQYKKAESLKKLDKTRENVSSVESLRREIAPHMKFLANQVEKIQKMKDLKQKLCTIYRDYFFYEEKFLQNEKLRLQAEKSGPEQELANLEKERKQAEHELSASKGHDALSDEVMNIQRKLDEIRRKKDEAYRDVGRIEGEVNSLMRLIERERLRAQSDSGKTVLLSDVRNLANSIEEKSAKISSSNQEGGPGISLSTAEVITILQEIRALVKGFIESHHSSVDTQAISLAEADIAKLEEEKRKALEKNSSIEEEEKLLQEESRRLQKRMDEEKDSSREAERKVFSIAARENELRGQLKAIFVQETNLAASQASYEQELGDAHIIAGREAIPTKDFIPSTTDEVSLKYQNQHDRRKEIEKLKIKLEDGGIGNAAEIMKEYSETEERDAFLLKELTDLKNAEKSLLDLLKDLDARLEVEFKSGMLRINTEFQNFFAIMFGGGTAKLELVKEEKKRKKKDTDISIDDAELEDSALDSAQGSDEEDANAEKEREGIDIGVSLPRKKVKSLLMLSGGERALTSIALLFSISRVKPPPFIILDETDAALDEANSKKYGDMIQSLSDSSQLILITHNRETMSRAGVIYGVTMSQDGSSKVLSIAFEEAVKVAK